MIRSKIGSLVRYVGGDWLASLRLRNSARRLGQQCDSASSLSQLIDEVQHSDQFRAHQKDSEIRRFLEIVRDLQPKVVCEIGAARGGSLCMFSRVVAADARLLSIDLNFSKLQKAALPAFAKPGQHVACLEADSHQPATLAAVRNWLGGRQIDLLFIDGDHTYDGVARDFEMYAPLVRSGGVIGFHDIVPDYKTRFNTPTINDVGEVPAFWQTVKNSGHRVVELIDNPEQDGYGIGVVHWSASKSTGG